METRVVHKGKSIYKSPIAGWFIMGEIPPKWMRTRGTPILGNLHFDIRKKRENAKHQTVEISMYDKFKIWNNISNGLFPYQRNTFHQYQSNIFP